ncbi:MAG: dienelactone hydrolase family protein [Bacteroidia bacterium]|nr:dienelactone hydrolase family protein [Bacteroidia bacterium]
MKKLLFLLLVTSNIAIAQQHSCCDLSVTQKTVTLAMNQNFALAHLAPEPFVLQDQKGEMITFPTIAGMNGAAYMIRAKQPGKKVLFVFHEWWGLNDYIKQEAERFANEMPDVTVYAVDLYDGAIATDVPNAQGLLARLTQERGSQIIKGLLGYVGSDKHLATTGWCLGGAWSLQCALIARTQAKACVIYYGMPELNIDRLKTLNCPVLGIFGLQDKFINVGLVKTFEENMKKAGKKLIVHNYDADHAFANPSNPKHNHQFAEDAHAKTMVFIKANLK